MLRRKLLLFLGFVVVLLVLVVVAALWLLHGVMEGQDHVNTEALTVVEKANDLNSHITLVQVELYRLQLAEDRRLDRLIERVAALQRLTAEVGTHYVIGRSTVGSIHRRIDERLPEFRRHVGALATARNADLALKHNQTALRLSVEMQRDALELARLARVHAREEQKQLAARFRWTVVALTVAFLVVINVSVIVLMRMWGIVVQPVEKLVEASRQLGLGRFDYRVHLDRRDEFDELAKAYNQLAEQLEAAEERRLEVLGHVALTLNHELNNASAIIELQLQQLSRRSGDDPRLERCLRQIHENLARMHDTVVALKNVRRIVLTDYIAGVKMLDLQRSSQVDSEDRDPEPAGEQVSG